MRAKIPDLMTMSAHDRLQLNTGNTAKLYRRFRNRIKELNKGVGVVAIIGISDKPLPIEECDTQVINYLDKLYEEMELKGVHQEAMEILVTYLRQ